MFVALPTTEKKFFNITYQDFRIDFQILTIGSFLYTFLSCSSFSDVFHFIIRKWIKR